MFPSTALLSFLIAAMTLGTSAAPVSSGASLNTLAIAANIASTGATNIIANDQARAKALLQHGLDVASGAKQQNKRAATFSVTNAAVTYTASVGVGSPATQYNLIIDTGSSNTWIGASKAYAKTGTSSQIPNGVVNVNYGSGSMAGTEYTDTVSLSPDLVIQKQSIGVASLAKGFNGVDGILGLGPVGLTAGSVEPSGQTVPTVLNNLKSQGTTQSQSLGVFFAPTNLQSTANGALTFGGYDTTKITAPMNFVPITKTSPASSYWGVDQTVTYDSKPILSTGSGIVDTGTTLILLATDAYNAYVAATGAVKDSTTGLLTITADQYANLKTLNFVIGGSNYPLIPNAQIWPRALNTFIGGQQNSIYLIVADIGSNSGGGMDFINGYTFLERYYSYYDTDNSRVGFAPTAFTLARTN